MKIFWAWQADLPGKVSRHFVREALEEAIAKLRQPKDIEEPSEEALFRLDAYLDRYPEEATAYGVPGRHHDKLTDNSLDALRCTKARPHSGHS